MKHFLVLFAICLAGVSAGPAAILADNPSCYYINETTKTYFDLNPVATQDYSVQTPSSVDSTFNINPCSELTTFPVGNTACPSGSLSCQVLKSNGAVYLVAKTITSLIYTSTTATLTLRLTGGDYCPALQKYREAIIQFTCDTTGAVGAPVYVNENACAYTFSWKSTVGCPLDKAPGGGGGGGSGGSGGLSIGSILCIIFFCSFFVYFAAGAAYRYRVKEARGLEMVPNLEFWQGLPSLMKDGFAFTKDKINGMLNRS